MRLNPVILNPDKTELMWCSTTRRLHRIVSGPISLETVLINPATFDRNIGVIMDHDFSMSMLVGNPESTCFYSLKRINLFRWLLSADATKTIINSLVISQMNFCNLVWRVNLPTASTECNMSSVRQHVPSPGRGNATPLHHNFGIFIGFKCHSVWTTNCV